MEEAVVRPTEDPLAHIPCSPVVKYLSGQTVYAQGEEFQNADVYLVISGRIKVYRETITGRRVLVDICEADEFFGESALLGLASRPETAMALEPTKVMRWNWGEMQGLIEEDSKLGLALIQLLVWRGIELQARLEDFAIRKAEFRLKVALVNFAKRHGTPGEDGSVQMAPLTHGILSQYVGTSRGEVTSFMNESRREGYIHYSRQGITISKGAMEEWASISGSG